MQKYNSGMKNVLDWITKWTHPSRTGKYLKFMICYAMLPGTATFYFFEHFTHPITAYAGSCMIWGTVLYIFARR